MDYLKEYQELENYLARCKMERLLEELHFAEQYRPRKMKMLEQSEQKRIYATKRRKTKQQQKK